MATLQGDVVDAVTADLYPISKDDTPISAADIINGVSVPELLKLTKNEITDVVPSLDTPDVSRTDSFDEESGVLSKVDTAAPSFELTETDNHAAEDEGIVSETEAAVADTTEDEAKRPIANDGDSELSASETVGINTEAEQVSKSAEPSPTEDDDKEEGEVDNTITYGNTLPAEESFVGVGKEEQKHDSVLDEDDNNAIDATKLSIDESEVKDVSHDEVQYEDEPKLDLLETETDVTAPEVTAPSIDTPLSETSELIADEAAMAESSTTEVEVPQETADEFSTSNDVPVSVELPKLKEEALEADSSAAEIKTVAVQEERSSETEASIVIDEAEKEESEEAILAAVDEDLTYSTDVIIPVLEETSAEAAQDVVDLEAESGDNIASEISENVTIGAGLAPTVVKAEEDINVPILVAAAEVEESEPDLELKNEISVAAEVKDATESIFQEPEREELSAVQSTIAEIQEDQALAGAEDLVGAAIEEPTEATPTIKSAAKETTEDLLPAEDEVVESAVPTVELVISTEGESTVEAAFEETKEEHLAVEPIIEEPMVESVSIEAESTAESTLKEFKEEAVHSSGSTFVGPTKEPAPVTEVATEEFRGGDGLKKTVSVVELDTDELTEESVLAEVEGALESDFKVSKEEVVPADESITEESVEVVPVVQLDTEESPEEVMLTVDSTITEETAEEIVKFEDVEEPKEAASAVGSTIVELAEEAVSAEVVEAATEAPKGEDKPEEEIVPAVESDVEKLAEKLIPAEVDSAAEAGEEGEDETVEKPRGEGVVSKDAVLTVESATEEPTEELISTFGGGPFESAFEEPEGEVSATDSATLEPTEKSVLAAELAVEELQGEVGVTEDAAPTVELPTEEPTEEPAPTKVEGAVESAFEEVKEVTPVVESVTEESVEDTLLAEVEGAIESAFEEPEQSMFAVEPTALEHTKEAVLAIEPAAEETQGGVEVLEDAVLTAELTPEKPAEESVSAEVEGTVESAFEEFEEAARADEFTTEISAEEAIPVVEPVGMESQEQTAPAVDFTTEDSTEELVPAEAAGSIESTYQESKEEAASVVGLATEDSTNESVPAEVEHANESTFEEPEESIPAIESTTFERTSTVYLIDEESHEEVIPAVDSTADESSEEIVSDEAEDVIESALEEPKDDLKPADETVSTEEPQGELKVLEDAVPTVEATDELTEELIPAEAEGAIEFTFEEPEEKPVPVFDMTTLEPTEETVSAVKLAVEEPQGETEVTEDAAPVVESSAEEFSGEPVPVKLEGTDESDFEQLEEDVISTINSTTLEPIEEAVPAMGLQQEVEVTEDAVPTTKFATEDSTDLSAPAEVEGDVESAFKEPKDLDPTDEVISAEEFQREVEIVEDAVLAVESVPAEVKGDVESTFEDPKEAVPAIELTTSEPIEEPVPAEVEDLQENTGLSVEPATEELGKEEEEHAPAEVEDAAVHAFEEPKEETVSAAEMVTVEPNEEPVPAVEMTTEEFKELSAQPVGEEPESEIFKFSTDTFEESESQVSEHQNDVQTASLSVEKPTIAINTDVVDSAEIDTPSLITDVTSATGSSARPWTPSFQVTTVGRSISPVLEVEIADVETNSISVPVITTDDLKYEDMGDKSTMVSTELSEVEASLTPPRPWTPSYSVHSQGSPLLVAVNVDSSDGAVRDEDIPDVSEIEFAENPELPATNVSKPAESKHSPSLFAPAVQEPYVPEFPDILSDEVATMDDGTEKDVVIEQGEGAEGPLEEDENREAILNHPEILAGPSIIEPEPELIEELAGETPVLMHTMDENASGSIEETADVSIPSYFSPLFKAKECEETAEPAQSQEQAAIWVPSYSVSRQGSPLPKSQELPVSVDVAEDQSTSTCEATEAMESSASAPESLEASEVAPIVGADANEISALEELGSTRSLDSDAKEQLVSTSWVASYSVSRQGSPLPEVKSLSAGETENEPEVDTTESSNTDLEGTDEVADKSTTPVVVVTPDDKLVTVMESAPERPKSPWTPSYSVTSQGPASSAKSPAGLDNPIDIDVKATTNIQAEVAATSAVAIPVSEAKEVDTMENVSKHNIIEEQTPFPQAAEVAMESSVPTLPSVDENTVSETTSAIAESTNTVRKRLESTTSSRFFPGGWFSPSPKVPHEGRTSLEIAQGEFTSSKAIPTDDVSDIVPDSASESSTVPDDNATEAEEAEKEKKRGRWCVIM